MRHRESGGGRAVFDRRHHDDQHIEYAVRGGRGRVCRARTNPSYVYTVIDDGPNAASQEDVKVRTDSLGYVLSQGSAFLLDADNTESFDFPADYVALNFDTPPPLARSAALFRTVGHIDRELFATETCGYTQYGRAYLSLQSSRRGFVRMSVAAGPRRRPERATVPELQLRLELLQLGADASQRTPRRRPRRGTGRDGTWASRYAVDLGDRPV
jgi:hypothetical protein